MSRASASSVAAPPPAASAADAKTTIASGGTAFASNPPARTCDATASALSFTAWLAGSTVLGGRRHRFGASAAARETVSALSAQKRAREKTRPEMNRSTTTPPREPRPTIAKPAPSGRAGEERPREEEEEAEEEEEEEEETTTPR